MLIGKGYFIDQILNCENGDSDAIVNKAVHADLSHIVIKIANCTEPSNIDLNQGLDYAQHTARVLQSHGIQAWGWQYITGDDPIGEANQAIQRIKSLNLDGFVINAEKEYKAPGKDKAARVYMSTLRSVFPDLPLALSSYRFPSYHPQLPWLEFLEKCDVNMPKVFWIQAHNPYAQLARCLSEFETLLPFRPIIPTAAVFATDDWQPSSQEISEFIGGAVEHNLSAVNFWNWDSVHSDNLMDLWNTVQIFTWPSLNPTGYFLKSYFSALNSKDPEQVVSLYDHRSVHVTSDRSIQGISSIKNWYAEWFKNKIPTADLQLLSTSGEGNAHHFTWKATDSIMSESLNPSRLSVEKSFSSEYQELFQGIFYRSQNKTYPRSHTIHSVFVDLNNPDIDLLVTPRIGIGRTTTSFLKRYNLQLAVNGDEWIELDDPKGLAAAAGDQYSPESPEPTVFISKNNQVQIGGVKPKIIWDAISGSHTIVRYGEVSQKIRSCANPDVYCRHLAPRTAIGLTPENFLVLVVVEGPSDHLRDALTLKELAEYLVNLGAHTAITLDGGGSSTLVVEQAGVANIFNTPSDGTERAVSNHLGIYAKKLDTVDIIKDGSDTVGLLNDKIIYHLSLFTNP